jgi:hypothetical protein
MSREEKLRKLENKNEDCSTYKIKRKQFSNIFEKDEYDCTRSRMESTGIYEVIICDGCDNLKNNKLGIYCRSGSKRIRKYSDKIVCLDCDIGRLDRIELSKEDFENIENSKKN